ncbi:MAG TPA: hypothetical protein VES03_10890 [Motilibacterales bacterium]|nr:hypothetical protein [Motilibacterales bacterium]
MPEQLQRPVSMVLATELNPILATIAINPPALTRLEPQSISGDPAPGADAVVADALWMIGRQWQLGELLGEDVGSPVSVRVERRALPITAWAPMGRVDGTDAPTDPAWRAWPAGALLDEMVEHVPRAGTQQGLRWRAETGGQLAEMLAEAGHDDAVELLLAAHPLALPADPNDPDGRFDPGATLLHGALVGQVPDGGEAADALAAGDPPWATGAADPAGALALAREWHAWVGGAPGAGGAWTTTRLEHRFALRFGHGDESIVMQATAFGSGSARWHHLEWLPDAHVELADDAALPAAGSTADVMLATPLRYPGMPANRYWQLEEGSVDVSAIEAQPHDLARLCLAEFALVSGDDWLVVPVDGQRGAVNQVVRVSVTTTFGEELDIAEAGTDRRTRGFRMFEVTAANGDSVDGVVLPPIAATPLLGDPIEEVAFIRDETANLAWAVERVVPGRSGDPRQRSAEPRRARPQIPADLDPDDVLYELMTPVPRNWIPLVPVRTAPGVVGLRKGAMLDDDQPVLPTSSLLEPTPLTFPMEEIPREGITVRAVPALARRPDGSYARWTGHRIRTGRGEGSSGFASDSARPARGPGA